MTLLRQPTGWGSRPKRSTRRARPSLLTLEDRTVPTTTTTVAPDGTVTITSDDTPAVVSTTTTDTTTDTTTTADPPGHPVWAVGADSGNSPRVKVYDSEGRLTMDIMAFDANFKGGVRVAVGDVTGDDINDVIVSAGPGGKPTVKVFDGASGQLATSFMAYDPQFRGGVFVAVGDVTGDGRADIVTGAGEGGGPHVKVYDSKVMFGEVQTTTEGQPAPDLFQDLSFMAYDVRFRGGVTVAVADVNKDGKADIVTGAGESGGPHVMVFSGANGEVLQSFMAFSSLYTGGIFVAAGDITGDGYADIAVGMGAQGNTQVNLYDGKTGAGYRQILADAGRERMTVRPAIIDTDGDDKMELVTVTKNRVIKRNGVTSATIGDFVPFGPDHVGGGFAG